MPLLLRNFSWLHIKKNEVSEEEFKDIEEAIVYAIDQKYLDNIGYQRLLNGDLVFTTMQRELKTSKNEIETMNKQTVFLTDSGNNFLKE